MNRWTYILYAAVVVAVATFLNLAGEGSGSRGWRSGGSSGYSSGSSGGSWSSGGGGHK